MFGARHARYRRVLSRRQIAATLAVVVVAPVMAVIAVNASAFSAGATLYRSATSASRWVDANPSDPRAPLIRDRIANQPIARWLTGGDPTSSVSSYVGAAKAAGQVPVLVAYNIPNRDCGGASAGGAGSWPAYDTWIDRIAAGLGTGPVMVLLEPDALALNSCADGNRAVSLSRAVTVLKRANPAAQVYLDAGHSGWVAPAAMATRLTGAGVGNSDGFYTNASNFRTTADEVAYGRSVLAALGNRAALGQVIDTSRNGKGAASGGAWCDPAGRGVGQAPGLQTGIDTVDAFVWIKPPGESDGCRAGAGQFVPDLAYELALNGVATTPAPATTTTRPTTAPTTTTVPVTTSVPTTTTVRPTMTTPVTTTTTSPVTTSPITSAPTSTTAPTTTLPTTTLPTTTLPTTTLPTTTLPTTTLPTTTLPTIGSGTCSATYRVKKAWRGGFLAEVTVTGATAGWTVTWAFSGRERVTHLWAGDYTADGSSVTVRNMPWNPAGPTGFGFVGSGKPKAAPALSCS